MKQLLSVGVCCLLLFTVAATAQAAKPKDEHPSMAQVLDGAAGNMEREFVSAAEAMPEDKYGFAPTSGVFKGVRTFAGGAAGQHVAAVNYILGAAILQKKPPAEVGGESGPESITAKADILKYLKASFEYAHKAIGTINEKTYLEPSRPVWRRLDDPPRDGCHHYLEWLRSLRANSGVPAKQWDRTAGKPVISPFTPARRSWLRAVCDAKERPRESRPNCSRKTEAGGRLKVDGPALPGRDSLI